MRYLSLSSFFVVVALTICLVSPSGTEAATAVKIDAGANTVLESFFNEAPMGKELARKASGILVFPSIVKAGILLGGEYGEGVLRINSQSAEYYSTASGSIGLQLGLQQKSVIIMFMNKSSLDNFRTSDGWEVGVDGSIALVKLGAGGAINTNTAQQPVIGFVFNQKGFMGNLTLEGTKISKIVR